MPWHSTTDAGRFLDAAGPHLAADAVANTPVLTEADHWRRSGGLPGARAGWWEEDGRVGGAFVQLPDHPPLCSVLALASVPGLVAALGDVTAVGVDSRDAARVADAWRDAGRALRVGARLPVLRLGALVDRPTPPGLARVATAADRELLHGWFAEFRRRHPEDPSDRAYVVDAPLADGALVLWEVDGDAVAMASRTPAVAGVTRLGLAFQPELGRDLADAAFRAGCRQAVARTEHVVALSGSVEATADLVALGFEPAAERVLLVR